MNLDTQFQVTIKHRCSPGYFPDAPHDPYLFVRLIHRRSNKYLTVGAVHLPDKAGQEGEDLRTASVGHVLKELEKAHSGVSPNSLKGRVGLHDVAVRMSRDIILGRCISQQGLH